MLGRTGGAPGRVPVIAYHPVFVPACRVAVNLLVCLALAAGSGRAIGAQVEPDPFATWMSELDFHSADFDETMQALLHTDPEWLSARLDATLVDASYYAAVQDYARWNNGPYEEGRLPMPPLPGRVYGPFREDPAEAFDNWFDRGFDLGLEPDLSLAYHHRVPTDDGGAPMGRLTLFGIWEVGGSLGFDIEAHLGWGWQDLQTDEGLVIDVQTEVGFGFGVRTAFGTWSGRPRPFMRLGVECGLLMSSREGSPAQDTKFAGGQVDFGLELPGAGHDRWAVSVFAGRRSFDLAADGERQLRGYPWEVGIGIAWIRRDD